MLWEVEIQPLGPDPDCERIRQEYALYTHAQQGSDIVTRSAKGFLLEGSLNKKQVELLMAELLVDRLTEVGRAEQIGEDGKRDGGAGERLTVLLKPGVMDPAAMSVLDAAHDLELPVEFVRTFRRYYIDPKRNALHNGAGSVSLYKVLANNAIEQIVVGPLAAEHLTLGDVYFFQRVTIPLVNLDDAGLMRLSRQAQLSLNLAEMLAIQTHFRSLGREPADVELETLAQTWSEHCSHKTLKGEIDCDGRRFHNLLKETIFGATQEIRQRLGKDDWCVSVFEDNAGVVRFDERYNVCFKVETHNHPSAIEPYGGANTGLGGVIRDPLGTGLGAKPICNTDVFCFGLPETAPESLPPGVLHPARVIRGVVAGVRDYGNRMGIPTVNGAVCFDDRYLANPLVFCGTVGLIPVEHCNKRPRPGDLIVAVGGRTGRDGIHGATFSSIELTAESEKVSGGAVQIGNAITEKKLLDVLLQARDRGQFHAITDCGAGGFSSAIGEMAEKLGATVHLDQAPLKYQGLSYTEIWISEAQERMILAVPPENWPALRALCASEDVEATAIGQFEATGRLRLYYKENLVADLDMVFLHNGRPQVVRRATCKGAGMSPPKEQALGRLAPSVPGADLTDTLFKILSSYNVCSKEWIIRQYDHEVQGGTVIKPLVGVRHEGPGDAAAIMPVLGSWTGLAVGCGLNPHYGILDPYRMATAAVDEAVRNVVAVGADPARIALLDNFCWGNTERPEILGSLVRAAEGCRDAALAFGMPFISGKDSLNNEFRAGESHITIPPTLLISALGRVADVRRCITMDLKEPGNLLILIGLTKDEMGGSHYNLVHRLEHGLPPEVDLTLAPAIFVKLHEAIDRGLIRSCHDLSEGGLAVAAAEMAFAGNVGADLTCPPHTPVPMTDEILLFSESTSRFLVEVAPAQAQSLKDCFLNLPLAEIGKTCREPRLRIAGTAGDWIVSAKLAELKEAWQKPLRW